MHPTVDVYVQRGGRWVFFDRSTARATLAATRRLFEFITGLPVRCRWNGHDEYRIP